MQFDVNDFGSRIKDLRLAYGASQAELSRMLGVSATQISDIEKGKSGTSLERAVLLANFFNVSLNYLLGGDIQPTDKFLMRVQGLPDEVKERLCGYLDALGY